jgi:hypothetical protein
VLPNAFLTREVGARKASPPKELFLELEPCQTGPLRFDLFICFELFCGGRYHYVVVCSIYDYFFVG